MKKMEDKNNHIDQEFIDRSWKEMSSLLDKEMPEKRKNRRFIFWLFGAATIALMGLFGVLMSINTSNTTIPTPQDSSISTQKNLEEHREQSLDLFIERQNTKHKESTNIKESISNPITPIKDSKKQSRNKKQVNASLNSKNTQPQASILSKQNKVNTKIQDYKNTNSISNQIEAKYKTIELEKSKEHITNVTILPTLDFSLLLPEKQLNFNLPKKIESHKKLKKWTLGLHVSTVYPKIGGFEVGIHNKIQLNKKWLLHFGLHYALRKHDLSSTNNDDFATPTSSSGDLDPTSFPSPDSNTIANINNIISYENFHYFTLPIAIQYQLNQKWAFDFGGKISRLYGYRYTQNDQSFFEKNFNSDPAETEYVQYGFSQNTPIKVKALEYALTAGTTYLIQPNLHIFANYHHGLNTFAINNDKNYKWKQIDLGIRWYLK